MADAYLNNRRYIYPLHWAPVSTSIASPADGRIAAVLFQVLRKSRVVSLSLTNGGTAQDHFRLGIYTCLYTSAGDPTMTGATLLYDSGSISQTGTNTSQKVTLTSELVLDPGLYYVCVETEGTTMTYQRVANQQQVLGWVQFATLASYQALPATAPTMTNTGSNAPGLVIEVTQADTNRPY